MPSRPPRATSRPTTRRSRTASSRRSPTSWRRARTIARRRQEIRAWNATSPILKRGIALTPVKFGISFTNTMMNQAGALVHVYNDGSIALNHGGTEMGQGLNTKVAQVVAEEFQVDIDPRQDHRHHDRQSAQHLPHRGLLRQRPQRHGCAQRSSGDQGATRGVPGRAPSGREERRGRSCPTASASRTREISFDEAVGEAYKGRVHLSAAGFYATPKIHWDRASGQRAGRSSTSPMARRCRRWRSTR